MNNEISIMKKHKKQDESYTKQILAMKEEIQNDYMISVGRNGSGKSFGQLALAYDSNHPTKPNTRAATITCTKDCKFAVMGKSDYRNVLDRAQQRKSDTMIAFLRKISFMKHLSARIIREAMLYMECVKY